MKSCSTCSEGFAQGCLTSGSFRIRFRWGWLNLRHLAVFGIPGFFPSLSTDCRDGIFLALLSSYMRTLRYFFRIDLQQMYPILYSARTRLMISDLQLNFQTDTWPINERRKHVLRVSLYSPHFAYSFRSHLFLTWGYLFYTQLRPTLKMLCNSFWLSARIIVEFGKKNTFIAIGNIGVSYSGDEVAIWDTMWSIQQSYLLI
jgi:hypothetical protein